MTDEIESIHFKVSGHPQSIRDDSIGEMRMLYDGDMWALTTNGRVYGVPSDVVPQMLKHWGLDETIGCN